MPGSEPTNQLKRLLIALLCLLNMGSAGVLFAQATVLGSDGANGSYSTYNVNDLGIFRQYRFQATASAASGVRKWEWCSGTAATPDYTTNWRPYTGPLTISAYNQTIAPVGGTASAVFNTSSGGTGGFLQAVTSGNYYTFNITEYSTPGTPANEYMGVLQTSFNPVSITSVTQSPLAASVYPENSVYLTVTTSATPSAGEYIYVRYSTTLSFTSSTLLPVTISGTTGTVEIPCQAVGTTIYYYAYSSNRTSAVILADVVTNGQVAHDMSTLNLNNNGGPNYTYTVAPSIGYCGNYYVPSVCYPTIASFVTALNAGTVSCSVICNVAAGHTETAPPGGINLTQTGTSANTITFQKSGAGANPIIYAFTGTITLSTAPLPITPDGIFSLNGSDYITIDGIDLIDNNITTPQTMEYGYALFKASAANGCQNNTIKNCAITLKANNISAGPSQFEDGSRGIFAGDVIRTDVSASGLIITTAAGRNDNNSFTGNTIKNVHHGIIIRGYSDSSPYTYCDQGNIIGSSGAGNTIENFGSGSSASVYGIYAIHQSGDQISYNNVDNDASGGSVATSIIYGIFNGSNSSTSPGNITITYNTVSVVTTSSSFYGIKTGSSPSHTSTGTITIEYNTVQNCSNSATTSGLMRVIANDFNASAISISHNLIQNNSVITSANTTTTTDNAVIWNSTTTPNTTITYNRMLTNSKSGSGTASLYGYYNNGSPASGTENVSHNTVDGLTVSGAGLASAVGIRSTTSTSQTRTVEYDTINNISATAGTSVFTSGITVNATPNVTNSISYNIVSNISSANNTVGINCGNENPMVAGTNRKIDANYNSISNISAGGVNAYGLSAYLATTFSSDITANYNTVTNVTCSATTGSVFVKGITASGGSSSMAIQINNNNVSGIQHSGAAATSSSVYGINPILSSGGSITLSKNNIYDVSGNASNSFCYGVQAIGPATSTGNISNNFIQRVTASTSTNNLAVIGLYASCTSNNIIHNTIALGENATISGGTGFGCTGIYYSAGVTTFLIKNNIISVKATASGTGVASCVRRSLGAGASVVAANFSSSSDGNFYYINTAASNYIYAEGGSTATLYNGWAWSGATVSMINNLNNDPCFNVAGASPTSYKGFYGPSREQGSYYDVIPFAGGASIPQNLKLTAASTSYAESKGVIAATMSTDWEGDIRQGYAGYTGTGTAPDIGADEGGFTVLTASCELLPLELLNLRGSYIDAYGINELRWQTGNEINSDRIIIERSSDDLQFTAVGELPAAGNSTELLDYTFQDDEPFYGNNYYRLKMTDRDGTFTYSNTINIFVPGNNMYDLRLYPNPVHDILSADLHLEKVTELELSITDISGRSMIYSRQQTDAGTTTISLDTKQLSPGVYLLTVKDLHTGSTEFSNFVKSTTH